MLEGSLNYSVSGDDSENIVLHVLLNASFLLFVVEEVALALFTCPCWTFLSAIVHIVVFVFFPSMAKMAGKGARAAIHSIVRYESFKFPVGTGLNLKQSTIGW